MKSTIERNKEKNSFSSGSLVENDNYIIMVSGNPTSDLYFWGTIIYVKKDISLSLMGQSPGQLSKKDFKPFYGKVILENE